MTTSHEVNAASLTTLTTDLDNGYAQSVVGPRARRIADSLARAWARGENRLDWEAGEAFEFAMNLLGQ